MKKRGFIRALTLALVFNAAAAGPILAQQRQRPEARPDRYASIVMEESTGRVLYERDANQVLHPASTTKLMTAYLTFKAIQEGKLTLDQELPVSNFAASQPATNLFMIQNVPVKETVTRNGKKVTVTRQVRRQVVKTIKVEDALRGMLVHSGNDAAVVLAEAIAGSQEEFAKKMNEEAKRLSMDRTNFVNPNGLPHPRQTTTVEDMALMARALIEDFPENYHFFSIRTFTFNGHTFRNTNRMLGVYPGMDGLKTGWISSSGFNLVASAMNNNQRVIGVVFGANLAETRNEDMQRLLDYAFNKLKNPKLRFAYGPEANKNTPERYVELPPKALETPPPAVAETLPKPPETPPDSVQTPKMDDLAPAVALPQKMSPPLRRSRAPS